MVNLAIMLTWKNRTTSADFQGLVAAQSRALSVLSKEIAESIKRLSENNK